MADLLKKEHYDLIAAFEREHRGRMDKEDKSLWPKGVIYQDGHINELFLAFRRGHAYAMAEARASASTQPFDPYVMYGDGFHDGYLKGRREGYEAAEDELSSAPTPPAATAAPSDEEALRDLIGLVKAYGDQLYCKASAQSPVDQKSWSASAEGVLSNIIARVRALLSRFGQGTSHE